MIGGRTFLGCGGSSALTGNQAEAAERFGDLWERHAAAVLRYARRRVPDAEVDEVVAETFLVAWRRLDDIPGFALPWLLGVARGVSANQHRSARRRAALHLRLTEDHTSDWRHPTASSAERADQVKSALADMRESDRELLTLIAWDGLTHEQAAEALGCSRGTFAVRLHRARRRLRTALDREATEPDTPQRGGPKQASVTSISTPRPDAEEATQR
jgi:RNA polymerase sigma-70 factor, ECF subfamily